MHFTKIKNQLVLTKQILKKIALSKKDLYDKKDSFKYFIEDIIEVMLFQHHYA